MDGVFAEMQIITYTYRYFYNPKAYQYWLKIIQAIDAESPNVIFGGDNRCIV